MRVAVACKGFDVAHRFDLADNYTLYNVVNGIITDCQCVPAGKTGIQELTAFFKSASTVALVCGAINIDDARLFCAADIDVVAGATGNAREAVEHYLTKTLIGADDLCHPDDDEETAICDDKSCCTL